MSYVSLYRKYRPQTFDDVVGQEHVTRTLRNAIEDERLAHAYLFTGPRGTGKTSTARILAKAVNCESGPTPIPCGSCEQCTSITDGTSVDVIELDMASHGGVDDARELRERALFAPASARHKIYILDEVHMASNAAFNALLKLIEEPPAHVLFAMATTDPQKVLPTIMSRVQRLDLRRVGADAVAAHVRQICDAEQYTIDDGAIEAVVRAGDGSVRDTLSVLEQVLAYAGRDVTAAAVAQTLGQTPVERVISTVDLIAACDVGGVMMVVQSLLDDGHDLRRFTLDLAQHLRDLLVLQAAPEQPDLVDATDDRRERLQAQAQLLPQETLLRAVARLADTIAEQRLGSPRLPLELCLAQLAVPGADGDVDELADRVARLEAAAAAAPASPAPASRTPAPEAAPAAAAPAPNAQTSQALGSSPESGASGAEPASAPPSPEPAAPTPAPTDPVAASASGQPEPARPEPASAPAPAASVPTTPASAPASGPKTPAPEPQASAPTQDTAEPDVVDDGATARADNLDAVVAVWPSVLEVIKQHSRRHHAMIEPATPVGLSRGILTLRYGRRHASFHAVQAKSGETDKAVRDALEQICGIRVRLDIKVEGEDDRRRPVPPSVTPEDARTPVLDREQSADGQAAPNPSASATSGTSGPGTDAPGPEAAQEEPAASTAGSSQSDNREVDEAAEVREAEQVGSGAEEDVDALLKRELNAQLLEESPSEDGNV